MRRLATERWRWAIVDFATDVVVVKREREWERMGKAGAANERQTRQTEVSGALFGLSGLEELGTGQGRAGQGKAEHQRTANSLGQPSRGPRERQTGVGNQGQLAVIGRWLGVRWGTISSWQGPHGNGLK